ncbi:MAG: hypothetical protein GT600_08305 [Bacteroidales bacterium]|jgi:hypothetical protein|nr:hypothetical protein [Bacteroidales bacterium]NMD04085.1 hypothetical protein [Bacteroidales bacterium]OQB64864.1 MAG: hypothetical protein BWX96_00360 [Bacteroidetes bacterium ADurb.Bin145]HOU02030.1 hypothetical protein [Bacteroidales bacterium]HQK66822.1 hypothetical protein [Bacteroidales bacterium]
MANIRTLKKEIDTCVYEVISDCLTYSALNPEKNQDDVSSLISEAVMLRNNLFRKINAPLSGENDVKMKKHFQEIRKEFTDGIDDLFGRLSSLSKKKKK